MRRLILCLTIISIFVVSVLAEEPLILIHGLNENSNSLNGIATALTKDGFNFTKTVKPSFSSDQTIEKMANIVDKYISNQNINTQSVIITHSMGGLVARQCLIDKMNNSEVQALITIASPNTGASISDPGHWLPFVAFDAAVMVTPVLVDLYWEKPTVLGSVSSPIITAGKWMVEFMKNFVKVPKKTIVWTVNKVFTSIWDFLNLTLFYPSVQEMVPSSAFLTNLNEKTLPSAGKHGKPIWYASIYGSNNNLFDLEGGVKDAFSAISLAYAVNGGVYILAGGWWNWPVTAQGLLYISSAALLLQPPQQFAWNLVVGSSQSDAVVPVASQKFPKNVVPSRAHYVKPYPAQDANHFTEIKPTPDVNNGLKYILKIVYGE